MTITLKSRRRSRKRFRIREAARPHVQSDQDAELDGSGNQEVDLAGHCCHDIAEIATVKDTIEESDLHKNTKSSKKYKIAIDESAAK